MYGDGAAETNALLQARMEPAGTVILIRAGVAGALGLVAVIFSIAISIRIGRTVTREMAGLRLSALELAELRLPRVVARLRRGESVNVAQEAPPITVAPDATSEIWDLASAFDSVQSTAVDAAVEQARLREGVSEALRNLARRSQSLLQRQLKLLDGMQREAEDPEALQNLFKLDHLTTRMRRHAEGLVLLSGGASGRKWRGTIPVEDVLSGAAAQVEDYPRVRVYPMPESGVSGTAVADLMHLFAELIENATAFSSPGNEVSVRGELVGRGFVVEIEDRGLGMRPQQRDAINARLASPPEFDPSQTERLGFAVVGLLAAKHGVSVTLKPSPFGGTTAIVLVPAALIEPLPTPVDPAELIPLMADHAALTGAPELPRRIVEPAPPASADLPRRNRNPRPVSAPVAEVLRTAPEPVRESAPVPAPAPVRESAPTPTLAGVAAPKAAPGGGLPRRVRQANLPPQLREPAPPPPGFREERSPEEARAVLSSLQSGWRRGREDSEHDGGSESS
jgi:signal transduction histidine kinase